MAAELLAIPEDQLSEVIRVIRNGLGATRGLTQNTRSCLIQWCNEEEDYLARLQGRKPKRRIHSEYRGRMRVTND